MVARMGSPYIATVHQSQQEQTRQPSPVAPLSLALAHLWQVRSMVGDVAYHIT
jgi:hypothetical protein